MAYSRITNPMFLRLQSRFLPMISAFCSGGVMGYMITDNENYKKFQKFQHIAVPQAPGHSFYVYMHNERSRDEASAALEAAMQQATCLNNRRDDKV